MSEWISCVSLLPRNGVEVATKIDDVSGCRNETKCAAELLSILYAPVKPKEAGNG